MSARARSHHAYAAGGSQGFAFLEFSTPEAAQLAITSMDGAALGGRSIKVGRPHSMNAGTAALAAMLNPGMMNPAAAVAAVAPMVAAPAVKPIDLNARIYVGSIQFDYTDNDVRAIFEPFGPIKSINLMVTRRALSSLAALVSLSCGSPPPPSKIHLLESVAAQSRDGPPQGLRIHRV